MKYLGSSAPCYSVEKSDLFESLPNGIYATDNAYIRTGQYVGNYESDVFEVKVSNPLKPTGSYSFVGNRILTDDGKTYDIYPMVYRNTNSVYYGYSMQEPVSYELGDIDNKILKVEVLSNSSISAYIDNVLVVPKAQRETIIDVAPYINKEIFLFCLHSTGYLPFAFYPGVMYYYKRWINGVMVADFNGVRNKYTGMVGMLDSVTGLYKGNANSTGKFHEFIDADRMIRSFNLPTPEQIAKEEEILRREGLL